MTIEERLRIIIVDLLDTDEVDVVADAEFVDLAANSLELAELLAAVEEEFGIEIADAQAEQIETVAEAIAYLTENATA
ncbi:MAG: hypothetical protein NVSMB32_10070 [Actinomycetota bacterium]